MTWKIKRQKYSGKTKYLSETGRRRQGKENEKENCKVPGADWQEVLYEKENDGSHSCDCGPGGLGFLCDCDSGE